MTVSPDIALENGPVNDVAEDILSPPEGWESSLWRALISVGLLLASWLIGRLGMTSWLGEVVTGGEVVSGVVALTAALVAGVPLFRAGLLGLFSDKPSATLDQLAGLAVLAAVVRGDFTTAVIVALALDLGHLAEERGVRRAGAAIDSLVRLTTRTAHRIVDSAESDVRSDQLVKGDHIVVYPGEVIPADGKVESGHTAIDPAHLTGESTPIDVGPGDDVFHGTVNLTGRIQLCVERVSSETSLGRVIESLSAAEKSRPPVVRLLEKYAGLLLPIVILIAAATFVISRDATRAIAILIVACPCALVLSSPAAMIPALNVAVRKGILIKSGAFLERAANVATLIVDKTGTITLGELAVQKYVPVVGVGREKLEEAARIAASGSRHPISRAIAKGGPAVNNGEAIETPGQGISVRLENVTYQLGRLEWVTMNMGDAGGLRETAMEHPGPSTWVGRDGCLLGLVLLFDEPRPGVKEALEKMKDLGVRRRVLLTGDRKDVAAALADQIGFDRIEAEVLPEAKNVVVDEEMENLRGGEFWSPGAEGVMFVGDGVNDALALNRADVGVALGAMGSEVALQSADIALMTNDLNLIPFLVHLSRRVHSIIRTNVLVGVGFSVFMLLLAMLGIITPIWGAILHHGGTLFVIGNSLRLLNEGRGSPAVE